MKTGPFAEHSNQLWNISAVPSWSKVNQGLIRMYKAEEPAQVSLPPGSGACALWIPALPITALPIVALPLLQFYGVCVWLSN
ncbi:hypothetical protein G5576_116101 [Homo sapiens]|uniref:Serine/threonine-protein phosphatase 2A activator n=1 Tax=Homo sapiens TaxID=9606 RepID=A0A6Q8PH23_HUMAN|nr:hypothetical protein KI723_091075 [Homo sapiens]KAI2554248.1 hypothetical protein KI723_091075 [Homo sapiens]KAI4008784.1 hypothetical protein G5576_116101 [Homo sapiens]KAI4008785.1 hypothetical protein G5576_116101 [Homo sapiens]